MHCGQARAAFCFLGIKALLWDWFFNTTIHCWSATQRVPLCAECGSLIGTAGPTLLVPATITRCTLWMDSSTQHPPHISTASHFAFLHQLLMLSDRAQPHNWPWHRGNWHSKQTLTPRQHICCWPAGTCWASAQKWSGSVWWSKWASGTGLTLLFPCSTSDLPFHLCG